MFNNYSPTIDRTFRFLEMIGVTAVIAAVLRRFGPTAEGGVIFFGTLAAILYWTEPVVNRIASAMVGKKPTYGGVIAAFCTISICTGMAITATPYVSMLAYWIAHAAK